MKKSLSILFGCLIFSPLLAQENGAKNITTQQLKLTRQGAMFISWGWNRAVYSSSDVHFTGKDYDFTVHNMVAHDHPTPFGFSPYFHPLKLTIPQTNFRVSYFFLDNLALIFGVDHMKYIMDQNQVVRVTGKIENPKYATMVKKGFVDLSNEKFLTYEHTDGLNYPQFGVEHYLTIYANRWLDLNYSYGAGIGWMWPKSNVQLFENERSDRFHIAGFGLDARATINLVFIKHILLRAELKGGYINMPSIRTTSDNHADNASQQIFFGQWNVNLSYFFQTKNVKKRKKNYPPNF